MPTIEAWWPLRILGIGVPALLLLAGCVNTTSSPARESPRGPILFVGAEHTLETGTGDTACSSLNTGGENAVKAALEDALAKALSRANTDRMDLSSGDLVSAYVVEELRFDSDRCLAQVQAAVDIGRFRRLAAAQTRTELRELGRPIIALVIETFRVLPNINYTTRRSSAEIIDSLQQDFVVRGFDVRRSLTARQEALQGGGDSVRAISSAERSAIAAAASKDGVNFLVQGEVKVSDEGEQPDGRFLAIADGSFEAVDLRSERVVGAFRDVAGAKHTSASAAYTMALSHLARRAVTELSPQMLDTWKHTAPTENIP